VADLRGRVAWVTGAGSGIGEAGAVALAALGATVVLTGRRKQALEAVAERINASGGGVATVQAGDLTKAAAVGKIAEAIRAEHGRLDIVVNNAGISGGAGSVESTDVATWQRVQAVNSEGVFLGCKYAIQGMKRTGPGKPRSKGSIVNLSSVAGLQAGAGAIAYTASKGAVRLLSKSVALYCAEQKYDIRCNSVHPGGVDTPIFDPLWQMVGRDAGKAFLGARHPIGHMAAPHEIGEVILWLASDRSSFVTGAEIAADGGISTGLMRRQPFVAS